MFVVSVSKNKLKMPLITAAIVIVLSVCLALFLRLIGNVQSNNVNAGSSLNATTEEEILEFISRYGWEVDSQPSEVRDVVIPEVFDEVYSKYNEIQLEQGFDLEKYAGQRVKRWTYIIRNYPDTAPEDDFIRINLLVADGVVVGGDVCSVKLDGFMHGFSV